jgi:lipopolysaccharide biosynthesis glycosyltransferase
MRIAIVTASNEPYFGSLRHLLRSLAGIERLGRFSTHVFDVGLSAAQRDELAQAGHAIHSPGWDVDVSPWKGVPEWFKAMTARPFLPKYVHNVDMLLWLDADIWVQDLDMLLDFVRAAQGGSLAVCLELERSYDNLFMRNASREIYYNNLSKYYGDETANRLVHLPMMNCGAFAMLPDNPLWSLWQTTMSGAVKRHCSNFLEQTALNMAVYSNAVTPHFLPARYNWMTCHALPLYDDSRGVFVEPNLPHDKIGLMHLACGLWKRDDIEYRTTTGAVRKGPLRPPAPRQG